MLAADEAKRSKIKMAMVVVHGAGRNADEYFCTGLGAVQLQKEYAPGEVLVVAPCEVQTVSLAFPFSPCSAASYHMAALPSSTTTL
jgi:hypothetical protein